jgi:hypothetical protein
MSRWLRRSINIKNHMPSSAFAEAGASMIAVIKNKNNFFIDNFFKNN